MQWTLDATTGCVTLFVKSNPILHVIHYSFWDASSNPLHNGFHSFTKICNHNPFKLNVTFVKLVFAFLQRTNLKWILRLFLDRYDRKTLRIPSKWNISNNMKINTIGQIEYKSDDNTNRFSLFWKWITSNYVWFISHLYL